MILHVSATRNVAVAVLKWHKFMKWSIHGSRCFVLCCQKPILCIAWTRGSCCYHADSWGP